MLQYLAPINIFIFESVSTASNTETQYIQKIKF